jgi:hypothetical protein
VRGLTQDKGHLIEAAPETKHLFGLCREAVERIGGPASEWWRRAAERHEVNLVTHDAVEIGLEQTRQ